MELAIPLVALAGLYFVSKKEDRSTEGRGRGRENFRGQTQLPNVDIPNKNYPDEHPVVSQENELTSKLSTVNAIDSPYVYTDKYFNPNMNKSTVNAYSNMTISGTEQQKSPYYSLTGDKVKEDYFSHNNMVPYFGSHIRSRTLDGNSNESILDSYQGQGSQTITKSEQSPLFAPGENYNYAYGAPNQNDFYQSRVNPSLRMANVKPFEEEHRRHLAYY